MKHKIKVFFAGATPYADNRGVSALYRGLIEFIRMTFRGHDIKVYVWHTYPESMQRFCKGVATADISPNGDISVRVVSHEAPCNILSYTLRLLQLFLTMILLHIGLRIRMCVLNEIIESDFVVELNFGDILAIRGARVGHGFFLNILRLIVLKLSGKPILMFPQTIGPFKSAISRALISFILNGRNVKSIAVREPPSYIHVADIVDDRDKITLVPDVAFLVPSAPLREAVEILRNEGLSNAHGRALIGIVPDPILKAQKLANLIDHLIEDLNVNIILIPHVTILDARSLDSLRPSSDCRRFCLKVMSMTKRRGHIIVLVKEYTVEQLWGVMKLCDIIISSRMHATIGSLKHAIPVIALSQSVKTFYLMKSFGMERFILPHDFNENEIMGKLKDTLRANRMIRSQLEDRLQEIRALLQELHKRVLKFYLEDAQNR